MAAPAPTDPLQRHRAARIEWPSVALCAGVYGAFLLLTLCHAALPWPLVCIAGALLLALHSSMQHEFLHGHPTRWRRVNRALAFPPLSLWVPFDTYRRTHLIHHHDDQLTDPYDDPETYYWSAGGWERLGPMGRLFLRVHSTLAGRLLFGPAWAAGRFLAGEVRALRAGDRRARRVWAWHLLGVAAVLFWVVAICGMNPLFYVFGIVYPGTSVLLLRSYAEHRAEHDVFERTAIVENAPIFGFLFLYNNLHVVHHRWPTLPWYVLPGLYKRHRAALIAENGGLVYDGYADVARRYLFAPHHVVVHPFRAEATAPEPRAHEAVTIPVGPALETEGLVGSL